MPSAVDSKHTGAGREDVLIGRFGAAHGIKGEVRLKAFVAEPLGIAAYNPLLSADGRAFTIESVRPAAGKSLDMLVVRVRSVRDRNAAEALNGTELFVPRERLPEPEDADEFYHADLIGLAAETVAGEALGTVIGVENYGAGDLLEVAPRRGETLLVPFTRAVVPEVDFAGKRVIIDPPPGLIGDDSEDEDAP